MAPTLRLGLAAALVATGVLGVARAAEEAASASATPTATPPLAIVELTEDTFKGVVSGETPVLVELCVWRSGRSSAWASVRGELGGGTPGDRGPPASKARRGSRPS